MYFCSSPKTCKYNRIKRSTNRGRKHASNLKAHASQQFWHSRDYETGEELLRKSASGELGIRHASEFIRPLLRSGGPAAVDFRGLSFAEGLPDRDGVEAAAHARQHQAVRVGAEEHRHRS